MLNKMSFHRPKKPKKKIIGTVLNISAIIIGRLWTPFIRLILEVK